jgi:hypothetical protein
MIAIKEYIWQDIFPQEYSKQRIKFREWTEGIAIKDSKS